MSFSIEDLLPGRDTFNRMGKTIAKEAHRTVRRHMDRSDFGPNSNEGGITHSTSSAFFQIDDPSGAERRFRKLQGVSKDDNWAYLEGGYAQFKSIYTGRSARRVNLELTGEMKSSMTGDYNVTGGNGSPLSLSAGINFKSISSLYEDTTPAQRADYVNEQYEFLYYSKKENERINKKAFEILADHFRRVMIG